MKYATGVFAGAVRALAVGSVCAMGVMGTGCVGETVEPGHRGLFFDPSEGLQHDVLQPGYHHTGSVFRSGRIDDFDVTYSTRKEDITTASAEGLAMKLRLAIIYRPIQSDLYELDTEIGPNYYDEVIGPEFRSAARGVLARHPYGELLVKNAKIEDEIEDEVRKRTQGKHVEVNSITMEDISYAPEIANAVRAKLVGEQEAIRAKVQIENDALKKKLEMEHEAEQAKMEAANMLLAKQNEKEMAAAQAQIDKLQAESESTTKIMRAKAEAQEITMLAKAHAAEKRAETETLTPLVVQMHAYDALGKLGGEGTQIMLGDWSRTPRFLFPQGGFGASSNPYVGSSVQPVAPASVR
jgi:regulator of protease activity HflC (stomatin/prohibitin superfamily)